EKYTYVIKIFSDDNFSYFVVFYYVIEAESLEVNIAHVLVADLFQTHQCAIGLCGNEELIPANDFNCIAHIDVFFRAAGLACYIIVNILFDGELFFEPFIDLLVVMDLGKRDWM